MEFHVSIMGLGGISLMIN